MSDEPEAPAEPDNLIQFPGPRDAFARFEARMRALRVGATQEMARREAEFSGLASPPPPGELASDLRTALETRQAEVEAELARRRPDPSRLEVAFEGAAATNEVVASLLRVLREDGADMAGAVLVWRRVSDPDDYNTAHTVANMRQSEALALMDVVTHRITGNLCG